MVRAASYGVPRAPYYSGTPLNAYLSRRLLGFHHLWPAFPGRSTRIDSAQGARNPGTNPGLGYSDFARRYSRNRCLFLFLQVLRCFSSLRSLLMAIHSPCGHPKVGFPHSEDLGVVAYLPARSERFVGYHVLHRLSMPRHPPYTLSNLITLIDHPRLRAKTIRSMPNRRMKLWSISVIKRVDGSDSRPSRRKGAQQHDNMIQPFEPSSHFASLSD